MGKLNSAFLACVTRNFRKMRKEWYRIANPGPQTVFGETVKMTSDQRHHVHRTLVLGELY